MMPKFVVSGTIGQRARRTPERSKNATPGSAELHAFAGSPPSAGSTANTTAGSRRSMVG
jgi:hypothetical protein